MELFIIGSNLYDLMDRFLYLLVFKIILFIVVFFVLGWIIVVCLNFLVICWCWWFVIKIFIFLENVFNMVYFLFLFVNILVGVLFFKFFLNLLW